MSLDISEMMDGELDDAAAQHVLATLRENEEARLAWEHYHVIGDALRGTTEMTRARASVAGQSQELQQRIFAALAQEPTVLAPPRKRALATSWQRYGMAVAATVAAFGLFSMFGQRVGGEGAPQQIAAQDWQRVPVQSGVALVGRAAQESALASGAEDPYLAAHFEVTPAIRPGVVRAAWQPNDQR
jgi:sigma-E factor negative regulatory protein RseA